mmetsp:Transcript_25541/g.71710  ORF Transcript_25541/g.71710 Transcript_25541/m.71710 type:complete len:152 (+) Transcript_25541:946-1401(+)
MPLKRVAEEAEVAAADFSMRSKVVVVEEAVAMADVEDCLLPFKGVGEATLLEEAVEDEEVSLLPSKQEVGGNRQQHPLPSLLFGRNMMMLIFINRAKFLAVEGRPSGFKHISDYLKAWQDLKVRSQLAEILLIGFRAGGYRYRYARRFEPF